MPAGHSSRLKDVDLSVSIDSGDEERLLRRAADRLLACQLALSGRTAVIERPPAVLIVFEGMDASGKGGAIRRLTSPLDPRHVGVIAYEQPTAEELARPYLWRFWRDVPRRGFMRVCDRSWYGRVMVERIEALATREEWTRAYAEINQYESYLVDNDVVLVKFWLHISKDEQKSRLDARSKNPEKRWKLTESDWHTRTHWDEYMRAAQQMIDRTSTAEAPWTVVAANNKPYARIHVVRAVCRAIAEALEARGVKAPSLEDIPAVSP